MRCASRCSGVGLTRRAVLLGAGAAATFSAARRLAPSAVLASEADSDRPVIWDGHVHLAGVAGTVAERVDTLLRYADRMGIERLVVSMGTRFVADPTPDEVRQQNDEVLQAIAHAPRRILGMVYLNPKFPDASLRELDRCVATGPMIGVKLWIALECCRAELDAIAHRAGELGVPVFQHTYFRVAGNLPGESSPADLAVLAARHPGTVFIGGHTGNDWERGVRAIRAQPNIYADLSGSDPTAGMVDMAVRELGPERVVFGSDAGGRSFASQLAKVYSAQVPEAAKRSIFAGNLQRLLGPILSRKGLWP